MVRLAGIEPTTPWFVAKYSIQLSYSRKAFDSSTGAVFAITAKCLAATPKARRMIGSAGIQLSNAPKATWANFRVYVPN